MEKAQLTRLVEFKQWQAVLNSDSALPEKVRHQFSITIRWYQSYCRREGLPTSLQTGKQFIETIERERDPEPWQSEGWRNGLRWFFRTAKSYQIDTTDSATEPVSPPKPAAIHLKTTRAEMPDWENTLRTEIRRRHYSLKTEKDYVGIARQFVQFTGPDVASWNEEAARRYLDHMAVDRRVAARSQKQSVSGLVFFLREALKLTIGDFRDYLRGTEGVWL